MIRGTTPTLIFELPFEVAVLSQAWITLSQNNNEVLTKELSDCEADGNTLTVRLTQEDTLKLQGNTYTQMQIRCKHIDGTAFASNIIEDFTEKILKDGVI